MVDVESLFEEIKGLNPHRVISLSWINSQSPVIKSSTFGLKLPKECNIDPQTGNIMVKHEGSEECICVDYTGKTTKRFCLFRKKRFA